MKSEKLRVQRPAPSKFDTCKLKREMAHSEFQFYQWLRHQAARVWP
jgi:hypothetical protein